MIYIDRKLRCQDAKDFFVLFCFCCHSERQIFNQVTSFLVSVLFFSLGFLDVASHLFFNTY